MVTLVAIIFGQGHPHVDRGLACNDRHVGSVGNEQGPLHQGPARIGVFQGRKAVEDVDELVASLAATHVDNNIGIRPAGDLVLQDGLARAERPRDRRLPPLENREEKIEYALTAQQRFRGVDSAHMRSRNAHRPAMEQLQPVLPALCIAQYGNGFVDTVFAGSSKLDKLPPDTRRHENVMDDGFRLRHLTQRKAFADLFADRQSGTGCEMPESLAVEGSHADAARNGVAMQARDFVQRTLHTVENTSEQPRSQFNGEGMPQRNDIVTRPESLGRFVDLYDGLLPLATEHLAGQFKGANADLLTGAHMGQPDFHERSVDLDDRTRFTHRRKLRPWRPGLEKARQSG